MTQNGLFNRLGWPGIALLGAMTLAALGGQLDASAQEAQPVTTAEDLKAFHFQGFVLYIDLEEDTCSLRFSEINSFEKIKEVFPELRYTVIVSATGSEAASFERWIREHVFSDFAGKVLIDQEGLIRNRFGFGPGSRLFFYNREKELVYALPMTTKLQGRDYLEMFNDWY